MEIVHVKTEEELEYLYKDGSLTLEGLREDYIPDFMDFLKENTTVHRERVFLISGSFMNNKYGLTGKNAYKQDCNIVCVSSEDIDESPIIIKKYEIDGKWFNDIVDNNARWQEKEASRKSIFNLRRRL